MILGLTGPAGVGKDTVADRLVYMYGFKKVAFAQTLKAMMAAANMPEPSRDQKEQPVPGFDFTWRRAAQTLGTEWGRGLDPDIWVKVIEQQLGEGRWVISDVRFENEAKMVRRRGRLVHITGRATTVAGDAAAHVSEAGITPEFQDLYLDNSATPAHLYICIESLIGRILCI